MAATLKYNLKNINEIACSGFQYEIPSDSFNMINYLCEQIGSSGIGSNIFNKVSSSINNSSSSQTDFGQQNRSKNKKRRGNKNMEVSAEEWESIRTFETTKIEQKVGIDKEIDQIRLYLNKMTDKSFLDMRLKIIDKINYICSETTNEDDILKMGNVLYDISSSNKFYSKIFADLFAELATSYTWLKAIFDKKFSCIMEQYNNIHYIDPDTDYDGFCDMNKVNEKRKCVTTFYINLALNNFIKKEEMVKI